MKTIKKILLIDDSKAINRRNESLLKGTGLFEEIVTFSDPKEALSSLKNELKKGKTALPNIIFLDLEMPEMDGFNFLEDYIQLKEVIDSDFKPLVVIVSAHLDFKNFDKSKRYKTYGVLDHIKKPIDLEDINSLLEEHFQQLNTPS